MVAARSIFPLPNILLILCNLPSSWTKHIFNNPDIFAPPPKKHELPLHLAILVCVAALLLFIRPSCPLLEPDESRYAEIPRQMLAEGHFVEPIWRGQPYYHKPPLLYWLIMLSYHLFGVHDWAARLVPTAASLGTVLVTYLWGRRTFGSRAGFVSALILCLSARFIYLGRMLTMDALLSLWVVVALAAAHLAVRALRLEWRWWITSALAAGLGLLTKGPVTLVLVLVPALLFQILDQRTARPSWRAYAVYVLLAVGVASPWYAAMAWSNPSAACEFFWLHNVQRYLDPIDHEVLLIPLCDWLTRPASTRPAALGFALLALLWCVGFFSLGGCKRAAYILPALPLLALCLGCFVVHARSRWLAPRNLVCAAAVIFGLLLVGIYLWLPSYHRRFALRGQVRRHAEIAAVGPVYCYPKPWDSVTFYLGRDDVRVFNVEQRAELIATALAQPRAMLFVKTRFLPELLADLPPGCTFMACGRQGPTLTVGRLVQSN
jgi:4-amino-4-deoxy-L-arabinose transferase-like glycosyltransferase